MKAEIPIPDVMTGSAEGESISIGMPHTATLYLYRDGEQAAVVGEQTTYYDIPTTTYQTILTLLS